MTPSQQDILVLWQRVNMSLSAFRKLTTAFTSATSALQASVEDWRALGIHHSHLSRHSEATEKDSLHFLEKIQKDIAQQSYQLIFFGDADYPDGITQLYDPPPVLFYRGQADKLSLAQIAIVGSRRPTPQAQKTTFDMAQYLAQSGYVITSGLAQGIDAQAHLGALAQPKELAGRTIGVMGTGIDVCYPKQHHALIERIVNEGGCIISELLPNTQPNKHTFPRRNRLVAGLSLGTIVTEATIQSGSLITARLTAEQGKQVFAVPSRIDNLNAEGCHHLIREGATLIYHPEQVIADIANQTSSHASIQETSASAHLYPYTKDDSEIIETQKSFASQRQPQSPIKPMPYQVDNQANRHRHIEKSPQASSNNVTIPNELQPLMVHLDWVGQDLDKLIEKTQLDTPTLLSQLMTLELLGIIAQNAGRYKRLI
ncbi:DNA-processing protein DprA [Psychrobacter sp. I-STPA6b]|uniref:DNA-processing protein DprA n=1 Tax=Psychrobacter sp. I-STPA6b TaxID=2585718 RepID=UPI001D0C5D7C|nr:DNA-processing protein DprA [Psychrobacter sp. I-STPA6b]